MRNYAVGKNIPNCACSNTSAWSYSIANNNLWKMISIGYPVKLKCRATCIWHTGSYLFVSTHLQGIWSNTWHVTCHTMFHLTCKLTLVFSWDGFIPSWQLCDVILFTKHMDDIDLWDWLSISMRHRDWPPGLWCKMTKVLNSERCRLIESVYHPSE